MTRRTVLARAAVAVAGVLPLSLAAAPGASAQPAASGDLSWRLLPTGSTSEFRGLAAVSRQVAWLGGYAGVVLRTTDGGRSWRDVRPPGAGQLEFRDVEAFSATDALLMAAGSGTASRFYVTRDGGGHWRRSYTNHNPQAFYDCMAFFDSRRGLALSDPVDGRFRILATNDGGRSCHVRPRLRMPRALPGEFGFAASGTCLVAQPGGHAWFGTGGARRARVFSTDDGGRSWTATATPVRSGPTAGIYSLAFRDRRHGIAVGGDFQTPFAAPRALARTGDGGRRWTLAADAPGEYRSGSAYRPGTRTALVVAPTGSDISRDDGRTWTRFDSGSFDSVACAADGACWASGIDGRVARLSRG